MEVYVTGKPLFGTLTNGRLTEVGSLYIEIDKLVQYPFLGLQSHDNYTPNTSIAVILIFVNMELFL